MEKNLTFEQHTDKNLNISDFISSINNYDIELLKKSVNPSIVNKQIFKIFDDDKHPLWTPLTKISTLKKQREDDNRYNGKPITKSEKNDVELAKVVIDNGANIDDKDRNGNTALHYCVYYKNYELMKYLVDNGANVNIHDNNGNTPLMLAFKQGYKTFSDFLIDNGTDKNTMDSLEKQIEKTKQIFKDGEFEGKWVSDDTLIILENQLIILETLKKLSK